MSEIKKIICVKKSTVCSEYTKKDLCQKNFYGIMMAYQFSIYSCNDQTVSAMQRWTAFTYRT